HAERVEATAAVFLRRAKRPESGGLRLAREALEVLIGNAGRIRIEPLFERNDLLADEASNLLAEPAQLVRHGESGKQRHWGLPQIVVQASICAVRSSGTATPRLGESHSVDKSHGENRVRSMDLTQNGHESMTPVAVVFIWIRQLARREGSRWAL